MKLFRGRSFLMHRLPPLADGQLLRALLFAQSAGHALGGVGAVLDKVGVGFGQLLLGLTEHLVAVARSLFRI